MIYLNANIISFLYHFIANEGVNFPTDVQWSEVMELIARGDIVPAVKVLRLATETTSMYPCSTIGKFSKALATSDLNRVKVLDLIHARDIVYWLRHNQSTVQVKD